MDNPPVRIAKIAIGDGTLASEAVFEMLPTVNYYVRRTDLNLNFATSFPA